MAHTRAPVGSFKFTMEADKAKVGNIVMAGSVPGAKVSLRAMLGVCKYVTSGEQAFHKAVIKGFGSEKADLQMRGIELGYQHILLLCFTDQRFLDVLEDFKSGGIKERFKKEFSDIGIEIEGLVVNMEEKTVVQR